MSAPGRLASLALAFLLGAAAMAAIRSCKPEDRPAPRPGPDAAPPPGTSSPGEASPTEEPAPGPTAVRYRLVLPAGIASSAPVRAWWSEGDHAVAECAPATIRDGLLTIEVPPSAGRVSFHVRGCAVEEFDVEVVEGRAVDCGRVALVACAPLAGRVVDVDGRPIDGAFLWPEVDGRSVPLTGTDEDGTFAFDGLPEGDAVLRVECDGYVRRIVSFAHSGGRDPLRIVLQRGGTVHGRVLDGLGQPLSRAYLWIVDVADRENRERMAWPRLGEDGTFSVHLAAGRYELNGQSGGDRTGSTTFEVQDGVAVEVRLELARR